MLEKLKKNILLFSGLAAILYLLLSFYADYTQIKITFLRFNWLLFPFLLLLALCNYIFRFLKWHYYIKLLKIDLDFWLSYKIFMTGLVMSVTPGKFGEVIKAYLVKNKTNESISKTMPIIFVERLTDLISVIILALIGSLYFNIAKTFVLIVLAVFLGIVILLSNINIFNKFSSLLKKFNIYAKYSSKIEQAYNSSYEMIKIKPLTEMVLLSIFSWIFECIAYYLILLSFNINFGFVDTFLFAVLVYTLSTIIGSISMLPGGLGAAEISFTAIIQSKGINKEVAVVTTMLIRFVTLWFALILGSIFALFFNNELKNVENIEK
ncbi:MAG TPA: lysylphosphatidylglycerol synthase transmembrane domain-containing protein [Ignavibacteriales bacterium]|nr:lysylphosphatidylglycerol synthase transmembrane domain-containing protein [Ignavibacteriales bacterium]HOL82055.1 lysylphosphatidylglycerol synthase transmembrane domain-containing protein [Ignavibacteriales bacterium]HOM66120.1 lysylphosphatidylglycerol synthase transmembrane domain-containing protein [Ignavibacteriales bacterium]HPD66454.1 lysylphosphatidylglycerol synthase transmembrane domain-containing protein [Ignavibacteriales bacterium]HPP34209.1 lysylphosphatidylglycerol synthase t